MPTGYTAKLCEKDVPFGEFVLNCAKAFLGQMKERDGPIPEKFEADTYHRDELSKARARKVKIQNMTDTQADFVAADIHAEQTKQNAEIKRERLKLRERLVAMRTKVEAWEPPTEHHEALKKFVLDQLQMTIESDSWIPRDVPRLNGAEWRHLELAEAQHKIDYHEKGHNQEVKNTADTNAWVEELRRSLA